MIKCPNCGSTAQIKNVWMDGEIPTEDKYAEYKCGCGCRFIITYTVSDIKVVKED